MGVKQTKKAQKKSHHKKSVDDGFVTSKNKRKTDNKAIWNEKRVIYLWGFLPIVLLLLWTSTSTKSVDDSNKSPLEIVLDKVVEVGKETAFYDRDIPFQIVNRTIQAKSRISKGSLIMDIPRGAQLWQTDALIDPFVRDHLFSARHATSGKLVDHKAYLAAYLALMSNTTYVPTAMRSAHSAYLNYLPKEEDYKTHPIFQSNEHLSHTFGDHSMAYNLIRRLQLEWESEYQAFVQMSPDFAALIPRLEDYLVARIHVSSRSYSTLTSPQESDVVGSTRADLELYLRALNYDYAKDGFMVMVPILDALNHSLQNYNVEYRYNPDSHSFSIFTTKDISKGTELIINYGSKVDQWLYANYGFINTDGSGRSGASLAAFHSMHSARVSVPEDSVARHEFQTAQRKELLAYFQHDDGVDHCVGSTDGTTPLQKVLDESLMEFKHMKMTLLETIVNDPLKWMVSLPPRMYNAGSTIPSYSNDIFESLAQDSGLMGILSTCRLLALTKEDYFGRAKDILEGLVQKYRAGDEKFRMIPGAPALEYRARVWLKRLTAATLHQYHACPSTSSSAAEEADRLAGLQSKNAPMLQLMESHIRLAELQTLELLMKYSNQYLEKEKDAANHIRDEPCPVELSNSLLTIDSK